MLSPTNDKRNISLQRMHRSSKCVDYFTHVPLLDRIIETIVKSVLVSFPLNRNNLDQVRDKDRTKRKFFLVTRGVKNNSSTFFFFTGIGE